jgi:acyl dehydratase
MHGETLARPDAEPAVFGTCTIDELPGQVGSSLGRSRWHRLTQEDIDRFAVATGDFQWIHTDQERASRGPFSATVAHGYLTLSLATMLIAEAFEVTDAALIVNYGLDRVRFPAPLPANGLVRAEITARRTREVPGGVELTLGLTYEVSGQGKPCCVAEVVFRYYRAATPVVQNGSA